MPKFYIHRTYVAEVTEVSEIEASDEESALLDDCSAENTLGFSVGDEVGGGVPYTEIFTAEPKNIPAVFAWCEVWPAGIRRHEEQT